MSKSECLIYSNGFVDIIITKPYIQMSDKDCIEAAIKILTDEKADIEDELNEKREKASKEIEKEINRINISNKQNQ